MRDCMRSEVMYGSKVNPLYVTVFMNDVLDKIYAKLRISSVVWK